MPIRSSNKYIFKITNNFTGNVYEGRHVQDLIKLVNADITEKRYFISNWGVSMCLKYGKYKCYQVEKIYDPIEPPKKKYYINIPLEEQRKRGRPRGSKTDWLKNKPSEDE